MRQSRFSEEQMRKAIQQLEADAGRPRLVVASDREEDPSPAGDRRHLSEAAGIPLRPPRAWGKHPPAKPANAVTTDSSADTTPEQTAKPANEVTTDLPASGSACEPYREFIEQGLLVGRNAMSLWQELVDRHHFPGAYETVKRFVRK